MSARQQRPTVWQYIVLAALGAGFFLGLFLLVPDQPQGRMALLGLVILAGQGAVAKFLTGRVSDVHDSVDVVDQKVNGRMTELIAALNRAHQLIAGMQAKQANDVSRETSSAPVSRETSPRKAVPRKRQR